MAENDPLQPLRVKIDELDHRIVELLNARARIVVDIGKVKQQSGTPVYAPDREKIVLERIRAANKAVGGPLPNSCLEAIYRELMSGSFALEKPLRIAYLGPKGSFSHLASVKKFGSSVEHVPVTDIAAVFKEVDRGHADLGLVPIENSTVGGIIESMDAFLENRSLTIVAEVLIAIHSHLLANCPPEEVKIVTKLCWRIIPVGNVGPVTPAKVPRRIALDRMLELPRRIGQIHPHTYSILNNSR